MLRSAVLTVAIALAAAVPARADEGAIRKLLQERLPGVKIESVAKTSYRGLYEARGQDRDGDGVVVYTDDKVSYILSGVLYDGKTLRNVTDQVKWSDLPFDQSFTIVRGKGTRQMAYFGDPNCTYCRELDRHLAKLDDVTVHLFLYPVLAPSSVDKSKAVWCSPDRAKAWLDMMLNNIAPTAKGDCETPVDKNLALGHRLRITGTPTMFFENGDRVSGYRPADQLTKLLDQARAK
jgi:thiol:disulfide interchange protein DsbC